MDFSHLLKSRLQQHRNAGSIEQVLIRLDRLAATDPHISDWKTILTSILLIESRERPQFVRAIEWILSPLIPFRRMTCGIFQMRKSPFQFERSAQEVVRRLEEAGCSPLTDEASLSQIAFIWHGAATRQKGEGVGYADALRVALECVKKT